MADHISLKVKLDEDIRRFSVPKGINFAELHSLVSKHFVLAPENVQLKYIDDEEELITLGSDLELQEAKRLQPTVLRLNVYDAKSKRHTSDQPNAQYEAVFVRDVTVPDGTNVTAKVQFQKTWSVKNTSSAPWPKGVVLKMVDPKDDQLVVLGVGAINRVVGPGEETEIGVHLQAPSRPGRCVQYWRLFTEDGVAFGSRLWVDITVTQDNTAVERERLERMRLEEEEERCLAEAKAIAEAQALAEAEKALAEAQALAEAERARAEEEERRRYEEARRLAEEEEFRKRQEEEDAKRKQQAEEEERQRREEEERMAQLERQLAKEEEERRQLLLEQEAAAKQKLEQERLRLKEAARQQEEAEEKQRRLYSKYPGQLNALAEMGFTNVEHNVKLLDKHKGSLDLALEALLSGQ
jgi:hypothetical protein